MSPEAVAPSAGSPPKRPTWSLVLVAAIAIAMLAVLSDRHPGLRLVDFLSFSARADRVLRGEDLVHALYPVGYPLSLGALSTAADPLVAGRLLSALGGVTAVVAAARWLGPAAGLFLLVQPGVLTFGATEGTDMLAVGLGLAALSARTEDRPGIAGVLAGLAALTRYTSAALLLALLVPTASGDRRTQLRAIGLGVATFLLTTTPHWLVALWTGGSVLPDQSGNMAIGANARIHGLGLHTLVRLPDGLASAVPWVLSGPAVGLGLIALLIVIFLPKRARDRVQLEGTDRLDALRLAAWGGAHMLLVAVAFANTRLVLPTRLVLALGVALALRRWPRTLVVLTIPLALWTLPAAWQIGPGEERLAGVVDILEDLDGPLARAYFLTTDPWVYRQAGGQLESGTPIREVGGDPRRIGPEQVADYARLRGYGLVVVDVGRVQRTYPALAPLLDTPPTTDALHPVGRCPGYRVFALTAP